MPVLLAAVLVGASMLTGSAAAFTVTAGAAPTSGPPPLSVNFTGTLDQCVALANDPVIVGTSGGGPPKTMLTFDILNTGSTPILLSRIDLNTTNANELIAVDLGGRAPEAVSPAFGTTTKNFTVWFDQDGNPQNPPVLNPVVIPPNSSLTLSLTYQSPLSRGDKDAFGTLYDQNGNPLGTVGTDQSATSFAWDFGDGNTQSGSNNAVHVYSNPGVYTATFTSNCGGQMATDTIDITVGNALAHYALSYPNGMSALTCEPALIQITGHDASDAPVAPNSGTVLDLATTPATGFWEAVLVSGSGTWSPSGAADGLAQYVWPGGESSFQVLLRHASAASVNIDLLDSDNKAELEDPGITFVDTAFRVTDAAGLNSVTIGTQIAGKASNTGFGAQDLYLQAVRTDTNTGSCVGVFQNQTVTVEMASECINPASCEAPAGPGRAVSVLDNAASPIAIGVNDAALPNGNFQALTLDFDADSKAPLIFDYADAGSISLHARHLSSAPANIYLTGSFGPFVVRPFGFAFTGINAGGTPNPAADTPGVDQSTIFTSAGSDFEAVIGAYLWAPGQDADVDGVPDAAADITANGLAPNYTFAVTVTAAAPFEPASGVLGSINNGAIPAVNFSAGAVTVSNLQYTEVGSMTLQAAAVDYLGAAGVDIRGNSSNDGSSGVIGRFTPFDFGVVLNTTPAFAPGCSGFTYLDQEFDYDTAPELTITARNQQGDTTVNYDGPWWKLADFLETYSHAGTPLSGGVSLDAAMAGHTPIDCSADTCDGQFTLVFHGPFSYLRAGTPVAPFDGLIDIAFDVIDADQVSYASNPFLIDDIGFLGGNAEQRWGRMRVVNAGGSELLDLAVPLLSEYFDGGAYLANGDDDCTALTLAAGVLLGNPQTAGGALQPGTSAMIVGGGSTAVVSGDPGLAAGRDRLVFSAPGAGNTGFVDIELELAVVALQHLQHDWDGDGAYDDDPRGRASFGIFSGASQLIYTREPW